MASIDLQPTENKSPSHQTTITGAEAVVQALIQEGVDIAFVTPVEQLCRYTTRSMTIKIAFTMF